MSTIDTKETTSSISSRSKAKSFDQCYKSYCKSKNISPMRNLIKNSEFTLDFCVDKVKFSQWEPILVAIGEDISLECLSIRCRNPVKTILENIDSEVKAKALTKSPIIQTRYMLWKLTDAVSQCLSQTPLLTILQIEGLPLPEPYIDLLTEALSSNTTLKYIGLCGCLIGDSGCQKICSVIRNTNSVLILNLAGCSLTAKGVTYVAEMINFIKIMRYSENWQHTLRYQSPDLDCMGGLRRITLSDNPDIGDSGLFSILEVLTDDLWVKAIDFQHCGLTDNIAKDCIKFFENNSCLQVMDLRHNPQMSMKTYGVVTSMLRKNESSSSKYGQWAMLQNHPVFRNNQKICPQKVDKQPLKEKTSKTTSSLSKNESGDSESLHLHLLKEQLKNEVIMRRKLEELNAKLLQQVKELKANQIASWKAHMHDEDKSVHGIKVTKTNESVVKPQREVITIHLNPEDEVENSEGNSTVETEVNTTSEPDYDNEVTNSATTATNEKVKHNVNMKGWTGVNLLESFLQHKHEDRIFTGHAEGYTSEASSESSESSFGYRSNSSRSTIKMAENFK